MNRRRNSLLAGIVIGTLTLAACGGASDQDSSPTTNDADPAVTAAASDNFTEAEGQAAEAVDDTSTEQAPATEAEAPATDAPVADAPVADPAPTDPPATVAPATDAPVEAAPPAEPVLGGRALAADVQPAAQFDANPLPDLLVDDVGKGTQVNVANILPSDRPVLLWAWAPH